MFSEENGYQLSFVDCDNDSAKQLEAVRDFIQQGVDYIIIDPIVSTGWDAVLTECEDAGIPSSSSTVPSTTPTSMSPGWAPTLRPRVWPAASG